jgi:hypothetical protein
VDNISTGYYLLLLSVTQIIDGERENAGQKNFTYIGPLRRMEELRYLLGNKSLGSQMKFDTLQKDSDTHLCLTLISKP